MAYVCGFCGLHVSGFVLRLPNLITIFSRFSKSMTTNGSHATVWEIRRRPGGAIVGKNIEAHLLELDSLRFSRYRISSWKSLWLLIVSAKRPRIMD